MKLKNKGGIALILGVFLLVRLLFALRFHQIIWDEAVYLSIGKYLYSGGTSGLWEIIRPPGLPLLLGAVWKASVHYVFYSELLIGLFAAASLYLAYLLGKDLHSHEVGLLSAFLLAITPVFFLYSGFILTGIPSTFFVMLAVYLLFKKKFIGAGIAAGIASQFRFPQGLFLVAFFAALVGTHLIKKNTHIIEQAKRFGGAFVAIHIPFLIFNLFKYNAETSRLHHALFRPWILGMTHTGNPAEALNVGWLQNYAYYAIELFKSNYLLGFALAGLALYCWKRKYKDFRWNILLISLIFYAGFFSFIYNKQLRFSLTFLYIICIFSSYALVELISWLRTAHVLNKVEKKHVFALSFLFIFIFSYAHVIPQDERYYDFRYTETPEIVTEFYLYPSTNTIEGTILTADPVVAAYNSNLFIPIYFSLEAANTIYDEHKNDVDYVIYTNETFYCPPGADQCEVDALAFDEKIQENTLLFNKTFGHPDVGYREYYIYEITST